MASNQWIAWQLVDSAFPAGSFAHSAGLEASHQAGLVPDAPALAAFARDAITLAARQSLPLVVAAYRDPTDFPDHDRAADASLTNPVAHRTSRALGRALLHAADAIYPHAGLAPFHDPVRAGTTPGHLAPVFGVVMHALQLPEHDVRLLFLYQQLRSIVSAAVRLGVVGPVAGQRLQHDLEPHAQALAAHDPPDDELWQTTPVTDILQANQDRLYSRLFQS